MKTLIIIALIYFLFKKNKPHIPVMQGFAKLVKLLVTILVGAWNKVLECWTYIFMEVSCAFAPDEQKQMRKDHAMWLLAYHDWKNRYNIYSNSEADGESATCVERRIKGRSWTCGYSGSVNEACGVLSVMTIVVIFVVSLVFILCPA